MREVIEFETKLAEFATPSSQQRYQRLTSFVCVKNITSEKLEG
jgi:hypothetical protein